MTQCVRIGQFTMWMEPGPQELSRFKGFAIDQDGFGFDDGVDVRRETSDRPGSHGEFDAPGLLAGRTVPFSGWCRADGPEQMQFFRSQITGLLADGGSDVMVVDRPGVSLWGRVRLASKTKFRVRARTPRIADWQLQLWMPDPRVYGETRTFGPVAAGSDVDVFQYGNFPASPRFTVAGTVANDFAVYGPGAGAARKRYKVNGTVAPGHPNTIDLRTGYTYVDGNLRIGVVEDATNWAVPPGLIVPHRLDSNGAAATLAVSITDTYI